MQNLKNPAALRTLQGRSGSPEGGPYVLLSLEVINDTIVETHWETNGCPAAQKSACGLAAFLKGRTLQQASRMDADALTLLIGGLPEGKGHYAELAVSALKIAVREQRALGCETHQQGTERGKWQHA